MNLKNLRFLALLGLIALATLTLVLYPDEKVALAPASVSLSKSQFQAGTDEQVLWMEVKKEGDASAPVSVVLTASSNDPVVQKHQSSYTHTVQWNSGDDLPRIIAIPLPARKETVGKSFVVTLSAPTNAAHGSITSATVTYVQPRAKAIRVEGNRLVDAYGNVLQLRGANAASLGGFYSVANMSPDDPWMGNKPDWKAMKKWRINSVRITLNEASLLGLTTYDPIDNTAWPNNQPRKIGDARQADPGNNYKQSLINAVDEATAAGLYVILDMHMNAPDDKLPGFDKKVPISPGVGAYMQQPMADRDHGLDFWKWLSKTFKTYPNVIFDLFNEPYFFNFAPGNTDAESNWRQLRDGTTVPFYNTGGSGEINTDPNGDPYLNSRNPYTIYRSWEALGMQEMLDTVRANGATNVVMVAGVGYAGEMSLWLKYAPKDPLRQIAASWHAYPDPKDDSKPAWGLQQFGFVEDIAREYPVIIGELGDHSAEGSRGSPWASVLLPWADVRGISYLGWTWDPWNGADNDLIKDRDGTPTDGYGQYFRQHLLCVAAGKTNCP